MLNKVKNPKDVRGATEGINPPMNTHKLQSIPSFAFYNTYEEIGSMIVVIRRLAGARR